jgi:hypothetical protein
VGATVPCRDDHVLLKDTVHLAQAGIPDSGTVVPEEATLSVDVRCRERTGESRILRQCLVRIAGPTNDSGSLPFGRIGSRLPHVAAFQMRRCSDSGSARSIRAWPCLLDAVLALTGEGHSARRFAPSRRWRA